MRDLLAILALAVAAGLWALVQRLATRVDPGNPGVRRDCGGECHGCDKPCDE